MERRSVVEAEVLHEGSRCLAPDSAAFTLRGEIRSSPGLHGHQFFLPARPDPPATRNVARDMGLRDEDELMVVNGVAVSHWDHCILTQCLAKLALTDRQELVLVVRRRDEMDKSRFVFIELSLSFELDIFIERGIGDHIAKVMRVVLNITERISTVDIIDIHFKFDEKVVVKHNAIASHYLTVGDGKDVTMAPLNTQELTSYFFRRYVFEGVDVLKSNKPAYLCALKSVRTGGFLSAQLHTNEIRLTEGEDTLDTDIRCLKIPDPRLFRLTVKDDSFFLCSVLYDDYYLYYDTMGLRLKQCKPKQLDWTNFRFDIRKTP